MNIIAFFIVCTHFSVLQAIFLFINAILFVFNCNYIQPLGNISFFLLISKQDCIKKKTFFLQNSKRPGESCPLLFFCYLFIIFVIFRLFSLEKIWSVCRRGRSTGIPGLPVGGIPVFFVSRQACMHTDYSGRWYPCLLCLRTSPQAY